MRRKKLRNKIVCAFDSQAKFCGTTGINESVLSLIIHRKREPTKRQKVILEASLNTPIKELLQ